MGTTSHKLIKRYTTILYSFLLSTSLKMKFNSIDNDGSKMNPGKQMPIHRLAELTPKDIQISISKLIIFYETNKSFPTQYRSLIWRYLLKLPENSEEFGMLVRKGPHPAFESTSKTFDLKSSDRCKSICSLLAHWSPILAEVRYDFLNHIDFHVMHSFLHFIFN